MSNCVKNILKIEGDPDEIELLRNTIQYNEPDPLSPGACRGPGTIDFRKIVPFPGYIFQGPLGKEEEKETGNRNWYAWNRKYWGVKRNAYNCYPPEDNTIRFITDNSAPIKVIEALSWLFKDVKITHEWACENYCNTGVAVFQGGELIDAEYLSYSESDEKRLVSMTDRIWNS